MIDKHLNAFTGKHMGFPWSGFGGGAQSFGWPRLNLAAFWSNGNIDQNSVQADDYSENNNSLILKTGRVVNTDGISDEIKLPDVEAAVKSIEVTCASSTDTTIYATDTAGQTEDASASIIADGTYQIVTLTFGTAISGEIDLCTDGTNFFAGSVARVRFLDASENLIDEWIAAEHEDPTAGGLDDFILITRKGNVGSFVGCDVTNGVGLSGTPEQPQEFPGYQWFDGVDNYVTAAPLGLTGVSYFEINITIYHNGVDGQALTCQRDSTTPTDFQIQISSGNKITTTFNTYGSLGTTVLTAGTYDLRIIYDSSEAIDSDRIQVYINDVLDTNIGAGSTYPPLNQTLVENSTELAIGARLTATIPELFFTGLLYDIDYNLDGVVTRGYLGYGDTPWQDTSGSNNGSSSGNMLAVEDYYRQPPQLAAMDYNRLIRLQGTSDYLSFSAEVFAGENSLFFKFVNPYEINSSTPLTAVFSDTTLQPAVSFGSTSGFATDETILLVDEPGATYIRDTIPPGLHSVAFVWSGSNYDIYLDGSLATTYAGSSGHVAKLTTGFDRIGNLFGGSGIDSAIFDVKTFAAPLTPAQVLSLHNGEAVAGANFDVRLLGLDDLEDRAGSNDVTAIGGPEEILVPKHLTNNTDGLGNNFTNPRPTATTLNIPSGGNVEAADIAAYDSTQTVLEWFYNDGADKVIIDLGTPTISTSAGSLTSSGITSPTYYVNGVATATLAAGWNLIGVTTATGFNAGPITINGEALADKVALYTDQKSAADVLLTYNRTKLRYGL